MNNLFISQNVSFNIQSVKEVTINLEYLKDSNDYLTQVSAVADTNVDTNVTVYFRVNDSKGIFTQCNITILSGRTIATKTLTESTYVSCSFSGDFSPTSSETQTYIKGEVKEMGTSPTV